MEQRFPQARPLLLSGTAIRVGHSLQPDTWVAASSHRSSVWEAVPVEVGTEFREAMAVCRMDTIAPWSSRQSYSALPAQTAVPRPLCPPCWWRSCLLVLPKGFFYMCGELGRRCCWPCPGLVSHCGVSSGVLAALSAPPEAPPVQESPCAPRQNTPPWILPAPELLTLATDSKNRPKLPFCWQRSCH